MLLQFRFSIVLIIGCQLFFLSCLNNQSKQEDQYILIPSVLEKDFKEGHYKEIKK